MTDRTLPVVQRPAPAEAGFAALPAVAGLDADGLAALVADLGEPAYRARQIADAVWRSPADSWEAVSTFPRPLRLKLAERLTFDSVAPTEIRDADGGATEKALHRLADGRLVESVLMHYPARGERRERNTVCISSQAGCAVGCPFCATGELGFGRDLAVAEIVDQARQARRRLAARGRHLTNLVFMGMGEPLLNLEAVLGAVEVLTNPDRFGLGARHITISTSGVVPAMGRLAAMRPQWTLAVSLHAARNPLRDLLVPLNRRWPVEEVVAAAREYGRVTGRRVSYEYVMIGGINDTDADAEALVRLLRGSPAHVNCIPMNPVAHTPWEASSPDRIAAFASRVEAAGIGVTVRRNRGAEVGAACGQLAAERGGEPPAPEVARRRERLVEASTAALAAATSAPRIVDRAAPTRAASRPAGVTRQGSGPASRPAGGATRQGVGPAASRTAGGATRQGVGPAVSRSAGGATRQGSGPASRPAGGATRQVVGQVASQPAGATRQVVGPASRPAGRATRGDPGAQARQRPGTETRPGAGGATRQGPGTAARPSSGTPASRPAGTPGGPSHAGTPSSTRGGSAARPDAIPIGARRSRAPGQAAPPTTPRERPGTKPASPPHEAPRPRRSR